ncbi:hypothetical protein SAY87_022530 [Trapa incisa]|uniref:Uncharacterized protein n=1 Tax=Trapa incisa TaxID=236973 RepID=A0AAN7K4B2_9MYRT|nr:hypothetical protein SAY87_022530 [Trapa incisa]
MGLMQPLNRSMQLEICAPFAKRRCMLLFYFVANTYFVKIVSLNGSRGKGRVLCAELLSNPLISDPSAMDPRAYFSSYSERKLMLTRKISEKKGACSCCRPMRRGTNMERTLVLCSARHQDLIQIGIETSKSGWHDRKNVLLKENCM